MTVGGGWWWVVVVVCKASLVFSFGPKLNNFVNRAELWDGFKTKKNGER